MRILPLVAVVSLSVASTVEAQTPISELAAPTSPAFVLLNISPTSIERPESAKSFVLNAINELSTTQGFPKNYALEVAPYWMQSHTTLSFEQYQEPGVAQSLKQTFTISVATAPIPGAEKNADPLGTHVAIGVSAKFANGKPNPAMPTKLRLLATKDKALNELDKQQEAIEDAIRTKEEELDKAIGDTAKAPIVTVLSDMRRKLTSKMADVAKQEASIKTTSLEIQAFDAQRVGFFLTASAGQVWDFVGDDTQNAAAARRGMWITPAYRQIACTGGDECASTLDFIGVLRLLHDPGADNTIDYGGKFVWHPTREFNLSVEGLWRNAPSNAGASNESTDNSSRTTGMIEYRIKDDLSLYGTFGQDFKKATGAKPLVSLLGLNLGFGSKASVSTPKGQ